MKAIKIIKNRSDIGAGTRGSDMGIDAIEIAAINAGNDYFNNYDYVEIESENGRVLFATAHGAQFGLQDYEFEDEGMHFFVGED